MGEEISLVETKSKPTKPTAPPNKVTSPIMQQMERPVLGKGLSALMQTLVWTYSFNNNFQHLGNYSKAVQEYYSREVRIYNDLYDGYWAALHNSKEGIFSTKIASAIVDGITRAIGNKIYGFFASGNIAKVFAELNDKAFLIQHFRQAIRYAGISGTSALVSDLQDGELFLIPLRDTMFFANTNPQKNNRLVEIKFVKGTYIEQVKSTNRSYYILEHRYYKEKEVYYQLVDETKKELIPYRRVFVVEYEGNVTSQKDYNVKAKPINAVPFAQLPDALKAQFKYGTYNNEEKLKFKDLGVDLFLYGGNDPSVPGISVGQSILKKILTYVILWDVANSYKTRDLYNGKGITVLPKDLIQGIFEQEFAFSGLDHASVLFGGEKPDTIQHDLRIEDWEKWTDSILKEIAFHIGISPTVFSSMLNEKSSNSKTDDQIMQEESLTVEYIKGVLQYFEPPINVCLKRICDILSIEPVTIKIVGLDKVKVTTSDLIKMAELGFISKKVLLEKVFSEKSEDEIQTMMSG